MPHPKATLRRSTAILVTFLLAGCAPEDVFDYPVSETAERAGWPDLNPLGAFPLAPEETDPRVTPLEEAGTDLAARAEALRRRGAALAGQPVLGTGEKTRLAQASN